MLQEDKNLCTLYLVRHGETEWNKKRLLQGQLDSPLTEDGVQQAKDTAQRLKSVNFDAIFSSDLHRTKRTAEILKLERQLAVQTSKALRERNYGEYQGKSIEEYRENFKDLFDKVDKLSEKEQKKFKFAANIESDEEVISRFITQLREIAVAYPNKSVLVVTHGGCIRTFLEHTGYTKFGLSGSGISNAGHVKVLSDGVDFFIQEVKGIKKQTP